MTSNNHFSITSLFPFSFNAQRVGIITSAIIHAAIMLAILLMSATFMFEHLQVIQISFEGQEAFSHSISQGTKQTIASEVNQAQNKISMKSSLKPLSVQKAIVREKTVLEQRDIVKPALHVERPFPAGSGNSLEVSGSLNTEKNQGAAGSSAPVVSKAADRGIAETQFGEIGAPAFIHREMPVYPIMARRLGKEGRVVLKLLIDKSGRLLNVDVVEFAGFGFTEAAVAAVKNSTYAPASRNGEKVTTRALIPVRFHLQ
jgi:TonB family protein